MPLVEVPVHALELSCLLEDELPEEVVVQLWQAQCLQLYQEGDGQRLLVPAQ